MNNTILESLAKYDNFTDIAEYCNITKAELEKLFINMIRANNNIKYNEINSETNTEINKFNNKNNLETSEKEEFKKIEIILSEEQENFIKLALNGNSIFLTAPAGFGKSEAIHELVKKLHSRYDINTSKLSKIAVCASTGKAGSLINGRTVHSFLSIGLAKKSADELYERLASVKYLKGKYDELYNLKVLIIDEISMINNILLDKISKYFQLIKRNDEPFGGIQMIFVGDLCQLPPVVGKYCIESNSYKECDPELVQFTKCFRQNDERFQKILNEARYGELSDKSFDILLNETENIDTTKFLNMKPTKLASTNAEVDGINQLELNKLDTEHRIYKVRPISKNIKKIEFAMKAESIPDFVEVAIDAQIIITMNITHSEIGRIYNGSQGIIKKMSNDSITIKLNDHEELVRISYFKVLDPDHSNKTPTYLFEYLPIRLGYALSIHKAQGMSVSLLEVNLNKTFCHGQAYTAISRVRSLEGLKITGLKKSNFMCDKKIKEFYCK